MFASTFPSISPIRRRLLVAASVVLFLSSLLPAAAGPAPVLASHTTNPASVAIAGSLQSELGCSDDWQPDCAATFLTLDGTDDVWQRTFAVPAGNWEYKAALNGTWDENYGGFADGTTQNGTNIPLNLAGAAIPPVKFYYDHKSHWITSNLNSVIAVAPGDFQSELGCPDDWSPDCLRSWLQDPDGDGTYVFATTALPPRDYLGKVALNESWDVNFGVGGVPNGDNIAFTVPAPGSTTTFSYDSVSHLLSINSVPPTGPAHDNNILWDGLRHDSRDTLYRAPGGAVPAGTPVLLRFRTFHDDVTAVGTRIFSLRTGGAQVIPMTLVASGVDCAQEGLPFDCDYWQASIPAPIAAQPDNLWYRFVVTDGTDTDYYGDNTAALDGGLGATTDDAEDLSWALMQHVPGFTAPSWAKDAVIYQIFPDRFRNGRKDNDPKTGDIRYDDPVLKLAWGTLPEGYCRNYVDEYPCVSRFTEDGGREQPRGRDYMGGDLRGVDQKLDYLATLGVTAIYFNPIFDAGSNHSYDTQDYLEVDPYFGTQKDFDNLIKHADNLGIRVILDGVFNHMSSDSPLFDRYGHYGTLGACESPDSDYRDWFVFTDTVPGGGTCVGSDGTPDGARYESWFGFDSIPVLAKSQLDVQKYFLTSDDSVSKHWLESGASGWRLFPIGYAVLQWPPTIEITRGQTTPTIYGQVYVAGLTDSGAPASAIVAQVGFGADAVDAGAWTTWKPMTINASCGGCGNNYEYMGTLRPAVAGTYDYLVRFSTDGGLTWAYGDVDGFVPGGSGTNAPGILTVNESADTTAPAAPTDLVVTDWSAGFIAIAWTGPADPDVAEYNVYRSEDGGAFALLASVPVSPVAPAYVDEAVASGTEYTYRVTALDPSLNESAPSNVVTQVAEPKLVAVTFRVHVPASTPAGATIFIPGNIDLLGPWNPGKQPMVDLGGGIWEVTLQILDGTSLEYKYTRGTWETVEWWGSIVSTANRHVTIALGLTGEQLVDDTATDYGTGSDDHKAVQYWRDPLVVSASGSASGAIVTFERNIQPKLLDYSTSIVVKLGATTIGGSTAETSDGVLTWTPGSTLVAGTYSVTVSDVKSEIPGDSDDMQAPYTFSFDVP